MEGYPRLIPNERVRGSKLRRRPNWLDSQDPKELTLWQKQFIAVNWEATSVGLISSWEPWLKNLVLTLMADPQPALLLVDDDREVSSCIIYNEAYWPVIGDKVVWFHRTLLTLTPLHSIRAYKEVTRRSLLPSSGTK